MYKLLILGFFIFILILSIKYNYEHFEDKNIYSNKNLFINNKQQIDLKKINVNKLCIKDENGVECITKSELFNALELPIFRKHGICIEDACLNKNNIEKINGETEIKLNSVTDDTKCVSVSNIPASLSLRTQKRWETDRIGNKELDESQAEERDYNINRHGITYHSLYEPKGGWVLNSKDFCRPKHRKSGSSWECDKVTYPDKGVCRRNYGKNDYDSIEKYGCAARHRSSPGVCWQSAGRRCNSLRNIRRDSINRFYKPKNRYLKDGSEITNGLTTVIDKSCDNSTNFKIDHGKLKSDITGIIGLGISTKNYKNVGQHETHKWGKYT